MLIRRALATLLAVVVSVSSWPVPSAAQTHGEQVATIYEVLELPGIIDVMRQEGLDYADQIAADLIPGEPSQGWDAEIARIYEAGRIEALVMEGLVAALDGVDLDRILGFYESDPGRRIPPLEVSAREAMLEDDVEAAARNAARRAIAEETTRYRLISDFVEVNELVELNVAGGLNSNFAFYTGLQDAGGVPSDMTEQEILSDVWAQEAEIRANTTEWVYAFLLLAYGPLGPGEIAAFTGFSRTRAGQQMNSALFRVFDDVFFDISRRLGEAAGRQIASRAL